MSLRDMIHGHNNSVFMNRSHFASVHTWNGIPFTCVEDEETALKRKNNNTTDISWDNNTRDKTIYVPKADFPGNAVPNAHGWYDNMDMKILQVNEDMGMLTITLTTYFPREITNENL